MPINTGKHVRVELKCQRLWPVWSQTFCKSITHNDSHSSDRIDLFIPLGCRTTPPIVLLEETLQCTAVIYGNLIWFSFLLFWYLPLSQHTLTDKLHTHKNIKITCPGIPMHKHACSLSHTHTDTQACTLSSCREREREWEWECECGGGSRDMTFFMSSSMADLPRGWGECRSRRLGRGGVWVPSGPSPGDLLTHNTNTTDFNLLETQSP